MQIRMGYGSASGDYRERRHRDGPSGKAGGDDFKRHSQQQGGELRRRGAHFAYGTTPQVVSLGESKEFLAKAGRGNGRWDARQLEMAQNTGNHRFMRDGSNDPQ